MPLQYIPQQRRSDDDDGLPMLKRSRGNHPAYYDPGQGLVRAVNVALMLGQPLLVTGEAGVGKTQLAHSVAWELGLYPPLMFETKSTTIARDLFYGYDTLRRFHAAQTHQGSQRNLDYVTYNALGTAILRSNSEEDVGPWIPAGFEHGGQRRSVVLIDEIDKAPRDFPNDLLNEIEHLYFKAPELENREFRVGVIGERGEEDELRPIVIITSNSEKHLPDAFLRRCIYYHIDFPNARRLEMIVTSRIDNLAGGAMLSDALDFFQRLRAAARIDKRPATAELIAWLTVLRKKGVPTGASLRGSPDDMAASLCALVKTANDQDLANKLFESWLKEK